MENSVMYNLLVERQLQKWQEELKETEADTVFYAEEREAFDKIAVSLTEQEKKMLKIYAVAVENRLDYVYYNLNIRLLNLGVKIGMELERSFAEQEE